MSARALAVQCNALRDLILAGNANSPMGDPRWPLWAVLYVAFVRAAGGWLIGDERDLYPDDMRHPADPGDPPRHPADF